MDSLSFPDVNVWLALGTREHEHHAIAENWWMNWTGAIAFCRLSQLGLLRLLTTDACMDGKPLTNSQAIRIYDRFFDDSRVIFLAEAPETEKQFRKNAGVSTASPKLWADAWLLAFAQSAGGTLVTLDRALASRSADCLLLGKERGIS